MARDDINPEQESDPSESEFERKAGALGEELPGGDEDYPPVDFNTFVLSLSNSALMHLGLASDNEGAGAQRPAVNLPLAKHTIELLELVEIKSRGNLTGEEERLIQHVLYDLRRRYLKASSSSGTES